MGPTPSARHRAATPRPCRRTAMRPSPCDVVHSDSADAAGIPFTAANPAHACRAERLAAPQRGPRIRHDSGVAHGGQPAESGRGVFQPITHFVEPGSGQVMPSMRPSWRIQ